MHVAHLAYLLAPAYVANMAPPFVRFWHGPNPPLDDDLFGAHKTLAGFVSGTIAAVATAVAQALSAPYASAVGIVLPVNARDWPAVGLALGLGAMVGDCTKSALKRRRRRAPGTPWIPFDQLDFIVGALLMLLPVYRPSPAEVAWVLVLTFAVDMAVNRVSFAFGIKTTPW